MTEPTTWREWVVSNVILPLSPLLLACSFKALGSRGDETWSELIMWNTELPFFTLVLAGLTIFKTANVRMRIQAQIQVQVVAAAAVSKSTAAKAQPPSVKEEVRADRIVWGLQAAAVVLAIVALLFIGAYYANRYWIELPEKPKEALKLIQVVVAVMTAIAGGVSQGYDSARRP